MHWLPLVAMVIASALPFPHNPATAQPGSDSSMEDYIKLSVPEETSTSKGEDRINYKPSSSSGSRERSSPDVPAQEKPLRTEGVSEENSLPKDYKASRKEDSVFFEFSQKDSQQDSDMPLHHLRDALTTTAGAAEDRLFPEAGPGTDSSLEIDEMFLDAHPRVLFSSSPFPPEHPPLLLMLENGLMEEDWYGGDQHDPDGQIEGHGDRATDRSTLAPTWKDYTTGTTKEAYHLIKREKRSHPDNKRGEKSVCEAESNWVGNKTAAIDSSGQRVTIVPQIQTMTGPLKQYFYETRCRRANEPDGSSAARGVAARSQGLGVAGASCLGVDKKQWRSECKEKQSFVRALSKDVNNKMGWRWIRIDSSCVCVLLSRTNQRRNVVTRRGRV